VRTVGEARALIAIGQALAGSPEAMRARPPLSLAAPAEYELDEARLEALLTAAAAGLPVSFSLSVNGESGVLSTDAALSPLEKALAENQARTLAAAALVQLAAPGAPFIGSLPLQPLPETALHLSGESGRGGQSDAEVQARPAATLDGYPLALAYNQLKDMWALPLMGFGSWSSAITSGWEASVASSVATLAASLGGVDLLAGAGLLEGGAVFSAQQLVLDCESQAVSARIAQGVEVSEETIALETIQAVGIGGNALGQRHTRTHMRDVWRPRLFDRSAYEAWLREGKAGSEDKATELAAQFLATHEVPPLEAEKTATVRRIIATAGL
jgi:trimethylamine--corrinoid protein Co-methyltransferase